jgi:hypothetical protein
MYSEKTKNSAKSAAKNIMKMLAANGEGGGNRNVW